LIIFLLGKLESALDISNMNKNKKTLNIKNGLNFLFKEKNPIHVFLENFCKINFFKKLFSRLNHITIFPDK
jgi:regulatory protein YycH of two-component signal transduction system YycFG